MRTLYHLKSCSWILLVVLLAVTANGVHASVHAIHGHVIEASDQDCHREKSVSHHCPCSPQEQHQESDACDTCVNCACHAQLTVQPFQLSYAPIIVALKTIDPFEHLPEVYLPKFIPPQIYV